MRTGTLPIVFCFLSITAFSAVINVPGDYGTIQEAIDNTVNADTILVAPGVYKENLKFKGKNIHVKSSNGPAMTTIDADGIGSCVEFDSGEGTDAVLEGFTLTNGAQYYGGVLIYQSSPTVMGNTITANHYSGIIVTEGSNPLIIGNTIKENSLYGIDCRIAGVSRIFSNVITKNQSYGIAVFWAGAEIENNIITQNGSDGVNCQEGVATLINNVISNNTGMGAYVERDVEIVEMNVIEENSGGGIYMWDSSGVSNVRYNVIRNNGGTGLTCSGIYLSVSENTIVSNHDTNGNGGGLVVYSHEYGSTSIFNNCMALNTTTGPGGGFVGNSGPMTVEGNLIVGNTAASGGGIFCQSSYKSAPLTFENNVIINNCASTVGGGVLVDYDSYFINNTLHGNTAGDAGGGICCSGNSQTTIKNSILWNNLSVSGPEIAVWGTSVHHASVTVGYSDVKGGENAVYLAPSGSTMTWNVGNIDLDPIFVDPSSDDYHIRYSSPCRDAGTYGTVKDFEGDIRGIGGMSDIGADEFYRHLYYSGDATPGGAVDLKTVGLPGLDVLLLLGSDVYDPPLYTKYGMYYLAPPLVVLPLGLIPPDGVNILDVHIPGGFPVPVEIHMQALVNVQLSNDCLMTVE